MQTIINNYNINTVAIKIKDMETFKIIKNELIMLAKENKACSLEFKKLCNSSKYDELFEVIKTNIIWICKYNSDVFANYIQKNKKLFNKYNIFANENVDCYVDSYILINGSSNVKVVGYNSSNVEVFCYDSSNLEVDGYDSSNFRINKKTIECKINDFCIVRYLDNTISYNSNNLIKNEIKYYE